MSRCAVWLRDLAAGEHAISQTCRWARRGQLGVDVVGRGGEAVERGALWMYETDKVAKRAEASLGETTGRNIKNALWKEHTILAAFCLLCWLAEKPPPRRPRSYPKRVQERPLSVAIAEGPSLGGGADWLGAEHGGRSD